MKKFEYAEISSKDICNRQLMQKYFKEDITNKKISLNAFGREGWELAAVCVFGACSTTYFFKREIEEHENRKV